MIRHRNLVAPQIKSLVAESAFVLGGARAFEDIFVELLTSLAQVFNKGRRLRDAELVGVMRSLDNQVRKHLPLIRCEQDFRPPTRTRPKGEAHEFRYVFLASRGGEDFRLVSMRLMGTRKAIKIETSQLPVGFTYHVAERFLERTGNSGEALTELGRCLLDSMVFYKITEHFAAEELGANLMFAGPLGRGAILGDIGTTTGKAEGFEFRIEGIREYTFEPTWPIGTCFTAATYISDEQIGIDQMAVARDISAWKEENSAIYDEVQRLSCWPESLAIDRPEIGSLWDAVLALSKSAVGVLDTREHKAAIDRHRATGRLAVSPSSLNKRPFGSAGR